MFEDGSIKQKPLVYLAGSIMAAKDGGLAWRADITPHLNNLGYTLFNPVYDQPRLTGISKDSLLSLQKTGKIDDYQKACNTVVDTDISILKKASIVVAKIDEGVLNGAGTFGELTVARMLGIPVFAWIDLPGGINQVPAWAFGCITHYTVQEREFYKMIPSVSVLPDDSWDHWLSDT
jgi:nucleoside 2-deoxyribosyltransferase